MPKLPVASGHEAVKALGRPGFTAARQRGSHVVMKGRSRTLVVPLHPELDRGISHAIIREANISIEEFVEAL